MDDRAQSETLAIGLVFMLALVSAILIAGIGSLTLYEGQQFAETEHSVQVVSELDSKTSMVALEGGDSANVELDIRGDGVMDVRDTGRLRLVMQNETGQDLNTSITLGTVTYTNNGQEVAYQGGGIWRRNTNGEVNESVMVSPPEVHYQDGTLTLPMIQVSGDEYDFSRARVNKRATTRVYPNETLSNPIPEGDNLTMYITSEYYRAWGSFFDRRINSQVRVFDANNTVAIRLESPEAKFEIGAGLISVGNNRIHMTGSGGDPSFVDSYNSSIDIYENSNTGNGTVSGPGNLKLGGNTYIKGTVDIGGQMTFNGNNNTVYGDVWHQGLDEDDEEYITGETAKNGSGIRIEPIDETVTWHVNDLCDEDNVSAPSFDEANTDGRYCIDGDLEFSGSNDTLTFDLQNDNVSLAVKGNIDIGNGEQIEVINPTDGNAVKLWLDGDNVDIKGDVNVTDDRSPAFRLYAKSGTDISLGSQGGGGGNNDDSNTRVVGLIFAPGFDGGLLELSSQAELFGSAVVPDAKMTSGSAVHYDLALGGFSFERIGTPPARLDYFYVTVNEIEIEDG